MKITIMTLGFHPRPLEHILLTKKPQICYVVTSTEGLRYTASEHGYTKPNSVILRDAARKARSKLNILKCDPFEPESIGDAIGKILEKIKSGDEVTINYSGGTQAMSLVLGSVAIVLSRVMPVKVLYSTKAPGGKEKILDHTESLKELYRRLYEIVPGGF
jgi:hypothetical protein